MLVSRDTPDMRIRSTVRLSSLLDRTAINPCLKTTKSSYVITVRNTRRPMFNEQFTTIEITPFIVNTGYTVFKPVTSIIS